MNFSLVQIEDQFFIDGQIVSEEKFSEAILYVYDLLGVHKLEQLIISIKLSDDTKSDTQ